MKELTQQHFTGERALYAAQSLRVTDSVFDDGESPLKEGRDLSLDNCLFGWKYPLWYCRNVTVENCHWLEMARAGVWYTRDMRVTNAVIQAPKNFRRCEGLRLENVSLTRADETLWSCKDVQLQRVTAKGDYFAMNSQDLTVDGLMLDGNYSFDGVKNAVIRNSRLLTKDAFWNSENVTVYDSFLSGEYLGWNAKNLRLVNCTIESLQGLCYVEGLVLENCKLIHTDLAFEYSDIQADVTTKIDSVLNPRSGTLCAPAIGELIVETNRVNPAATDVQCPQVDKRASHPDWIHEED